MSDDKVKGKDVHGRRIDLSDGRFAFVGTHEKYPGDLGIAFRSRRGDYTTFRLSAEAVEALKTLLVDPTSGIIGSLPPPEVAVHISWQLIDNPKDK